MYLSMVNILVQPLNCTCTSISFVLDYHCVWYTHDKNCNHSVSMAISNTFQTFPSRIFKSLYCSRFFSETRNF